MSSDSHLKRIDSFELLCQNDKSSYTPGPKVNVRPTLPRLDSCSIPDAQIRLEKLTWKLSPFNGNALCQVILAVLTEQKLSKHASYPQIPFKNKRKCVYGQLAKIRHELESHPLEPPRTAKVQAFLQYILFTEYSPTKTIQVYLSKEDHGSFHRIARYVAQITECFKVASPHSEEIEPLAILLRQCVRDPALGLGIPLAILASVFYNYHIATTKTDGDETLRFMGTLQAVLSTQGPKGVARRITIDREILVPALRLCRSKTSSWLAKIERVQREHVVKDMDLGAGSEPCRRSSLRDSVKGFLDRCRQQYH